MLELTDGCRRFRNLAGPGHFSERPAERPETKFERRGRRLGHQVRDLLYRRTVD
jgi:tRNA (guanine-N7-)-methyltransferase